MAPGYLITRGWGSKSLDTPGVLRGRLKIYVPLFMLIGRLLTLSSITPFEKFPVGFLGPLLMNHPTVILNVQRAPHSFAFMLFLVCPLYALICSGMRYKYALIFGL